MVPDAQRVKRVPSSSQSAKGTASYSTSDGTENPISGSFHETGRTKRLVLLSDDELADVSLETKHHIDWRGIIQSARHNPERWKWQELDNGFTMFTRQDSDRFSVLVVGLVPGCVAECLNVLQSPSSELFAQRMRGIFEDELRDGAVIHRVELDGINDRQSIFPGRKDDSELAELMVKRMTFNKANWLSKHEEWCYLNGVYRSKQNTVVEKIMTTLDSTDVVVDAYGGGKVGSSVNAFHNVVCGYLLRAGAQDSEVEQDSNRGKPSGAMSRVTRVSFYAEFQIPKRGAIEVPLASASSGWRRYVEASTKTIKRRLLKLGISTARVTTLVRRQRLGLQALTSSSRLMPPTQVQCKLCTRMALLSKLCRICGHDVCSDCSARYERARRLPGGKALEVTQIRVCSCCIERIDQAEYTDLVSCWLLEDTKPSAEQAPEAGRATETSAWDLKLKTLSPSSGSSTRPHNVRDVATTSQLEILCDLAARELGCLAVLITVIHDDQFVVVASTVPHLQNAHISRTETLFAMVEHRATIVSHPQTTLRFSVGTSRKEMPVRFYCADPLIGEDNHVIGSMCCLHGDALKVSDAQVAKFKSLAQTASHVLQMETKQQRSRAESSDVPIWNPKYP